jgi:HEAT repeat protein
MNKCFSQWQIDRYISLLSDANKHVRADAAERIGSVADKQVVNPLARALDDVYEPVKQHACISLGIILYQNRFEMVTEFLLLPNNEEIVKTILVKSKPNQINKNKAGNLVLITAEEREAIIEKILPLLVAPNTQTRRKAALALAKLGTKSAIPHLLEGLADSNESVLEACIFALGAIGYNETSYATEIIHSLIPLLKSTSVQVRIKTISAIGKNVNEKLGFELLTEMLDDEDIYLQFETISSLGFVGDRRALPILEQISRSDSRKDDYGNTIYSAAQEAIAEIKWRNQHLSFLSLRKQ